MTTPTTDHRGADAALHEVENQGYHKGLKTRQVQMIAIGGAIGTGLFMGAGGRLAGAGPALVFAYAICGFFAFLILRALGELVLHRPTSGSFVSYAREFFGEKAAFVTGWLYWLNWSMTAVVDVTAVALYMQFFGKYSAPIAAVPQWVWALIALVVVLSLNLVSVKVFGELEFWFALIKVLALVAFLCVGLYLLVTGNPNQEQGLSTSCTTTHARSSSPARSAPPTIPTGTDRTTPNSPSPSPPTRTAAGRACWSPSVRGYCVHGASARRTPPNSTPTPACPPHRRSPESR